ncbi:MAG: hypothetical protein JXR97_07875 [Planctomycetes bacterium]|nr:hypothetical protein [Planctomycetota bacterium]
MLRHGRLKELNRCRHQTAAVEPVRDNRCREASPMTRLSRNEFGRLIRVEV